MEFINEYASKEDIKKYDVEKFIEKFKWHNGHPRIDNFSWTIDKERELWFAKFGEETDPKIDHASTRENIFILHYKDTDIEVRLWQEEDGQCNIYKSPFILIWKYLSATPNSFAKVKEEEIKEVLKEALLAYGNRGVRAQGTGKDAIVKFRNF